MDKKYEILKDTEEEVYGRKVYRIRALKDFSDVKRGDIGGYVESRKNLSQRGSCWVYDNVIVCGNTRVYDNARIFGNTMICGNITIYGYSFIYDSPSLFDKHI